MAPASDSNNLGASSSGDDFEFIALDQASLTAHQAARFGHWNRLVRGLLTLSKLRGFFGVLGHYLKAVKQRGLN